MPFASRSNGFYVSASLATVYTLCSGLAWHLVMQTIGTFRNDLLDDTGFIILSVVAVGFGLLAIGAGLVAYRLRSRLPTAISNRGKALG